MVDADVHVLIAELAVAIAGFSGVIVAFRRRAVRHWTVVQRRNLRTLLQVSAVAIFFSLFPLVLQRAFEGPSFWNIALAVYGIAHVIDVSTFLVKQPKGVIIGPEFIGLTIAITQIVVSVFGSPVVAEMTYLGSLVWHLIVAGMGFALLVWGRAGEETESID